MENGEPGANGPLVQRPVEAVTRQGAVPVAIQPLRMGAVPAKGPAMRQRVVTIRYVQVRNVLINDIDRSPETDLKGILASLPKEEVSF